ncbi:MAG TPA: NAD(P)H-dependent oxidoreductase [Vineibacter sp.]|nr:NAD(P)H-dependent oxidoreductase [Vineibacter sp.]
MKALLVIAHPEATAFSRAVLDEVRRGLSEAGAQSEIADLAREGFDPRIQEADLAYYRGAGPLPQDVRREQQRVDQADALILVFPIYWWSMPALLKGWIDRVFTIGWAFGPGANGKIEGRLADKPVRLLALGADDLAGFQKHGYRAAFAAQIEHGIFAFCGLRDLETHLLLSVESRDAAVRSAHLRTAYAVGHAVLRASGAGSRDNTGKMLVDLRDS